LRGIHDCLVPITPYLGGVFQALRITGTGKLPPKVRAVDMRHILLLLPFLLDNLMHDEVAAYNLKNPFQPIHDPAKELVSMVLLLLSWYRLYRRQMPSKDEEDIATLKVLGEE
jgi:hypothetical protein